MKTKEQVNTRFNEKFPLPKILALSGGKGVERDLMLMHISSIRKDDIDSLVAIIIGETPSHLTRDYKETDAMRDRILNHLKSLKETV